MTRLSLLYRLAGLMVTAFIFVTVLLAITSHSTALWTYLLMAYVAIRADHYGDKVNEWLHRRDYHEHHAEMIARMEEEGWDLIDTGDGYAIWGRKEDIDFTRGDS